MRIRDTLRIVLFPNFASNIYFVAVKNMTTGAGAADYLLGKNSNDQTDYYIKETTGFISDPSGMLAKFGIIDGQPIAPEDFEALCAGINPRTGEPLVKNHSEAHRAGTDFAISPPKDVSALFAVLPEPLRIRVEEIVSEANQVAVDYIRRYATTRMGAGGTEHVAADVAVVTFQHYTNREGEPHLHRHNVFLNLTDIDGKVRTMEPRSLFQMQTSADAIHQAHLMHLLQQEFPGIKLKVTENGHSFTIEDIPPSLVDAWSKRRNDMVEAAEAQGIDIDDVGGMKKVHLETRKAKGELATDIHDQWQAEAAQHGFGPQEIQAFLNRGPVARAPLTDAEIAAGVEQAVTKMLQTESAITENQLRRGVAEQFFGRLSGEEIIELTDKIKSEGMLLSQADRLEKIGELDGMDYYSTASMKQIEQSLYDTTKDLRNDRKHVLDDAVIEKAIAGSARQLTDEQADIVRYVCAEGSLRIGEGGAGTGKSTSMRAVADAFKMSGYKVTGLAPAWEQAKVLANDAGIEARAVAGFLNDVESGKLQIAEKEMVIVDESGLMGSRDAERLTALSKKNGFKLVLTGEEKQLNPVGAGPAMATMLEAAGGVTLETIRRQQGANEVLTQRERQMVADFRDGRSDQAIDWLKEQGRLHFHEQAGDVKRAMIADWKKFTAKNPGKSTLLLAVRNKDVRDLNDAVREIRRERGQIEGDDHKVRISIGDGRSIEVKMAKGDEILIAKSDKELDVKNKDKAIIQGISQARNGGLDIRVKTEDGRNLTLNSKSFTDGENGGMAIKHGYAVTQWSAQGKTVQKSFVMANGMDRRYAYVGMSRHVNEADLYVDKASLSGRLAGSDQAVTQGNLEMELAKQLHRKSEKLSTLDFDNGRLADRLVDRRKDEAQLVTRIQAKHDEAIARLRAMADALEKAAEEAKARTEAEDRTLREEQTLKLK